MTNKWVAGWGAAENYTSNRQLDYIKDKTFRYPIFSTVNAEGIRIRLSNKFGTENCVLTRATVAVCTEGRQWTEIRLSR